MTGTTIQAAPFNSNFQAVQTAVNNIDATNIGAVGLYASNLIPTSTAQATFGGTTPYTFNENLFCNGALVAFNTTFSSPSGVAVGDGVFQQGTNLGKIWLGGASGLSSIAWNNTNTVVTASSGTGAVVSANAAGFAGFFGGVNSAAGAYCPPAYTVSGAALPGGATTHIVTGSGTGNGATQTITLTGAAVFSSATSYQGYVGGTGAVGSIVQLSGTQFQVTLSNGLAYQYFLIGS